MKAAKTPRNRRAQDATLINITALKARVGALEKPEGKRTLQAELRTLKQRMDHLEDAFFELFNLKAGLKRPRR